MFNARISNSIIILAGIFILFVFVSNISSFGPEVSPVLITGKYSFFTSSENLGKLDVHGLFPTIKDFNLINPLIDRKSGEDNCGSLGCPNCLFNECFTSAIHFVQAEKGRVYLAYYDPDFQTLRKKGLCYMAADEENLIRYREFYDLVYEKPSAYYGLDPKGGFKLYSWREISASPYECSSAGILVKWQAVKSEREEELKELEELKAEKESKKSNAVFSQSQISIPHEITESEFADIEQAAAEELMQS